MSQNIIIGDVRPRIQLVADGAITEFVFPFAIFEEQDLKVYFDDQLQSAGFTIVGANQSEGGSVVFDTAPDDGVIVTILRELNIMRTSDFSEGGAFHATVINKELDYIVAVAQQTDEELQRTVKLSATDTDAELFLPDKATRAGRTLAFDTEGLLITGPNATEVLQAEENAEVATQSAILASQAQVAAEAARDEAQTFDPNQYRDVSDEITTADIADGSITQAKIDPSVVLGGPSVGPIRTNSDTISEDLTIPAGTNGLSAGPITIADGFTVTVNGNWSIV